MWSGQLFLFKSYLGVINFEISSRDPGHAHLGGRFKFPTQAGSALFICVSSLKRIAQFVQKLSRGPEIRKLGHVTPATPGLWVVLWFHCREATSSISVPNLKRIAHFVQTLLGGPKISKLGHVTQATPIWGRFVFHTQAGSVLRLFTKFEADCSIRSKIIKGSRN